MLVTKMFDNKAVLFPGHVEIHSHGRQPDDHHQGDLHQDGDHEVEDETGDLSCNRSHELAKA